MSEDGAGFLLSSGTTLGQGVLRLEPSLTHFSKVVVSAHRVFLPERSTGDVSWDPGLHRASGLLIRVTIARLGGAGQLRRDHENRVFIVWQRSAATKGVDAAAGGIVDVGLPC